MQPYFLPYIGYFSLIRHTDAWVVFDTAQFIRHGWIERNRILKPETGWQYFSVPLVKHSRETPINKVQIRNCEDWRARIVSQVAHYKKVAPRFNTVVELLRDAISLRTDSIVELNTHVLSVVCAYLSLSFDYLVYSAAGFSIDGVEAPDEWALRISKAIGAAEYVNPPGGIGLFDHSKYQKAGLKLTFLKPRLLPYEQHRESFEGALSIVDVMMFNSPAVIREMLEAVEFIPGDLASQGCGELKESIGNGRAAALDFNAE
jgi:hypothetical protein